MISLCRDGTKATLPAEETGTGGKAALLQKSFEDALMAHKGPKDAALFTDHDGRFYNHFFYFTPVAAKIAKKVVDQFRGVASPLLTSTMTWPFS